MISKHKKLWLVNMIIASVLTIVLIAGNIVANHFQAVINVALNSPTYKIIKGEETGEDLQYYKSAFSTGEVDSNGKQIIDRGALTEYGKELVAQVASEGSVLLMNNNDALPLEKGAKVTLFSQSSARLVYGGTGSGRVNADPDINLKTSLEAAGIAVNETMWRWYVTGGGANYERKVPSLVHDSVQYEINEAPWSKLTNAQKNTFSNYGDAAIVVFARTGGEESDLPRAGAPDSKNGDYLILNDDELRILSELKALKDSGTFDKIIVLLNTSNMIQLDFLAKSEYDIDACMWIGTVGLTGIMGVGKLLVGDINPSGRTVETYLANNKSNPALANFGKSLWSNIDTAGGSWIPSNNNNNHNDIYVAYQEGIYVGYRYYETRYEDYVMNNGNPGDFNYWSNVAFPFGSGKSYTDFKYSDFELEEKSNGDYELSVKVKNTGTVAGKHTVLAFFQSPYTTYNKNNNMEKASIELCGFEKTGIIQPNDSVVVTITIDKTELRAYDAYGAGTYILDAGDYYFTIAMDAHDAVNNILAAKGFTPFNTNNRMDALGNADLVEKISISEQDNEVFSTSKWTGYEIRNQFDNADLNRYEGAEGQNITYLSRNDWEGTFPIQKATINVTNTMKADGLVLSSDLFEKARTAYMEANGLAEDMKMPILEAKNNLNIMMLKDLPIDDPKWDLLIDQMSYEDLYNLIVYGFHVTQPVASIGLPGTKVENGPQGLTATLTGGDSSMAFTSADLLAATYNREIAFTVGEAMGEDCLASGYAGMYAPGANIHRTAYGGRNFEYYSEDSFVSGQIGRYHCLGLNSKGVFAHVKHFAFNEQESGRFGIATFANEQSLREVYLEAFENIIGNMSLTSVMSSYNRIGVVWTGAHRGLMVEILEKEWNSGSHNITDCAAAGAMFMEGITGIYGGTNLWDGYPNQKAASDVFDKDDPVMIHAMKNAAKRIAYTIARSCGVNGLSSADKIVEIMPWWQVLLITLNIVFGVLAIGFITLFIISVNKQKKNIIQT